MNPYHQLDKIAGVLSLRATLTKKDGSELTLFVKPETRASERFGATVPAAVTTREWSASAADFGDETNFPASGDTLSVVFDDGSIKSYDCARDAQNGRFWEWRYLRTGYRVRFTTKFNPKES